MVSGLQRRWQRGDQRENQQSYGVAVDSAGNIYIADTSNHRIRKVDTSGNISTVAGNGTGGYSGDGILATSAELYDPMGVAVDSAGNIYIADSGNNRVRKVDASTGYISTVAGNGTGGYSVDGILATSAELYNPTGVAVDSVGISTSRTATTTASVRWIPRDTSVRWRALGLRVTTATASWRLARNSTNPMALRWTVQGISTSRTLATSASVR